MRGSFGVGVEGISKSYNLGAVLRTANALGASFAFTIGATHKALEVRRTDTLRSDVHMPFYEWETPDDLILPRGCQLVGVELTEESIELPSFRHPTNCAYILGPEKGNLSDYMQERCDFMVQIPTKFCVNVSLAAALTIYDRTLMMGGYPDRPVKVGGPDKNWKKPSQKR